MPKKKQNPLVDKFMVDGCMRCKLGATPGCKVHRWKPVLEKLRSVISESELTEEVKWGMPCYTLNGKNILMMAVFKDYCSVSFFKGALLIDPDQLLLKPGENSQAFRYMKFTVPEMVVAQNKMIQNFIQEAIDLEKQGKKITFNQSALNVPEELESIFREDVVFQTAFNALTPGRQRGYLLHITNAVQSKTRLKRIMKCRPMIMLGKGLQD